MTPDETQRKLLALLDKIDRYLAEVRGLVLDDDPAMQEVLRKAKNGDG